MACPKPEWERRLRMRLALLPMIPCCSCWRREGLTGDLGNNDGLVTAKMLSDEEMLDSESVTKAQEHQELQEQERVAKRGEKEASTSGG